MNTYMMTANAKTYRWESNTTRQWLQKQQQRFDRRCCETTTTTTTKLAVVAVVMLFVSCCSSSNVVDRFFVVSVNAFQHSSSQYSSPPRNKPTRIARTEKNLRSSPFFLHDDHAGVPLSTRLHGSNNDDTNDNSDDEQQDGGVLDRFLNPVIDDPALPLTEAGIAQIIAPTLQLVWLRLNMSPDPSWARPLYDYTFSPRGALLAPTLIHGAGLACCWLAGCVAARAYEKTAFEGTTGQVVVSTIRAGAFACGLLVFATQFDLYQDFGQKYVQWGDSPETDIRIYRALVEVINDIFFEFVVLLSWRLVRSKVGPWVDGMN